VRKPLLLFGSDSRRSRRSRILLALNTWARPAAITDLDPATQYDARTTIIDLNPPGRLQTNKQSPKILATRGLAA
jgi:hypothetical protein